MNARSPLLVLGCVVLAACADTEQFDAARSSSEYPKAGLYTPGSMLGFVPYDASADGAAGLSKEDQQKIEDLITMSQGQARCMRDELPEGTQGTLAVAFTTESYGGFYAPENCGAVWIEDTAGNYIATPLVWVEERARSFLVWMARRCETDQPDEVSSATLPVHGDHVARWDTRDFNGRVVPDGTYVVKFDITEDEFDFGRYTDIVIEKGAVPFELTPPDSETVKAVTITYEPND